MSEAAPRRRAAPSNSITAPDASSAVAATPNTNNNNNLSADSNSSSSLNIFALMEDINDRLKLLNYEQSFLRSQPSLMFKPLHKLYFALPIKPSEQFPYYSHLISWLFTQINREILEWNEFDDPNTISSTIIEQMKKIGWDATQYTPTQLRQGYGEAVCVTLDYMTIKALQYKQFTVMSPIYKDEAVTNNQTVESAEGGEESDDEDAVIDTVEDDEQQVMGEDDHEILNKNNRGSINSASSSLQASPPATFIRPAIDPTAWALEYESVNAALKPTHASLVSSAAAGTKEWRHHHESINKHSALLSELFPPIKKDLDKLASQLVKLTERISSKEKYLNKEYDHIAVEMRELSAKQEDMQQQYATLSSQLATLNSQYTQKSNEVNELKQRITQKNDVMMDSSPVRAIQMSVKDLKKELVEMEVRIGIMSQSVGSLRMRRWVAKGRKMGQQERQRGNKGNGKGKPNHHHQHTLSGMSLGAGHQGTHAHPLGAIKSTGYAY